MAISDMEDLTIEKIKAQIKENLRRAREQQPSGADSAAAGGPPLPQVGPIAPSRSPETDTDRQADRFLWRYGVRYARLIKSIPVLRDFAERHYWRLYYARAGRGGAPSPAGTARGREPVAGVAWDFAAHLEGTKREGLKGLVKRFIFKFIGFFAWWQEQINAAVHRELSLQRQETAALRAETQKLRESIEAAQSSLSELKSAAQASQEELQKLAVEAAGTGQALRVALQQQAGELQQQAGELQRQAGELQRLDHEGQVHAEEAQNQRARHEILGQTVERHSGEITRVQAASVEDAKNVDAVRRHLVFIARKLDLLNDELRKRAHLDVNLIVKDLAAQEFSPEAYRWFVFEETFRGSRALIRERQSQYLDYVIRAREASKGSYLLDLGCGRGEFMEVLKEEGVPSLGVDLNEENVAACRERGLEAELTDALRFLTSVRNESLIGVTAFQVVEHLPSEYLIELISAAYEKVGRGGLVMFETVNPYSLFSLRNFYLDPSHRNPIPPDTLKYLVEAAGFRDVEVRYTSPVPSELQLQGDDDNTRKLNDLLFGFQDYAVIGWK